MKKYTAPKVAHKYVKHVDCQQLYCSICDGGLSVCEVCGGMESSLTMHCCEYKIKPKMLDEISNGNYDFVNGKWVHLVSH